MLSDRDYMRGDDFDGGRRLPRTAVAWLVIANVAVFLLVMLLDEVTSRRGDGSWRGVLAFRTHVSGLSPWSAVTFITSMFAHQNFFHLLTNMIGLIMFGREVERLLGPRQFIGLYLVSGLIGNLCFFLMNLTQNYAVLGASGCVFGVMAAIMVLLPNLEVTSLFVPVAMRMRTLVLIFMGIQILTLLSGQDQGVAHLAHLGGFVGGWAFVKLFVRHGPSTQGWKIISSRVSHTHSGSRIPAASPPAVTSDVPAVRRRKVARAEDAPLSAEEIEQQMDAVLEKVSQKGLGSLTRREREILEKAGDNFKKESR